METPDKNNQRTKFPFITVVDSIIDGSNLSSSDPPSEVAIEMFRKIAREHPDEVLNWAMEQAPEYLAESRLSTSERPIIDEETVKEEKSTEDEEIVNDEKQHGVVYNFYGTVYNFSNSPASIAPGGTARTLSDDVQINYVKIIEPIVNNIHEVIAEKPEFKEELEELGAKLTSASSKDERLNILDRLRDWYESHKDELKEVAKPAIFEIVKVMGTILVAS